MGIVLSNYLLFLSFQFNDNYFRIIFCGCLKLQALCLGSEYAKEMEQHFVIEARKPPHKQSSKTWQDDSTETTNRSRNDTARSNVAMNIINEQKDDDDEMNKNVEDTPTTNDKSDKMTVVVTTNDEYDEDRDIINTKPTVNRIDTVESEDISNDLTMSNDNNKLNEGSDDEIETQVLVNDDDDDNDDEVP